MMCDVVGPARLAQALCLACGSDPANGTEKKMGAYVMKTCFQTSCISSAMFITAMAANPLAVDLAATQLGQTISWGAWAMAGILPGLICLVSVPAILCAHHPCLRSPLLVSAQLLPGSSGLNPQW